MGLFNDPTDVPYISRLFVGAKVICCVYMAVSVPALLLSSEEIVKLHW